MKSCKLFLLFILLVPIFLSAQEEAADNFGMGGSVGTVLVGEKMYTQVRLMPELRFGKFGIGFDIDLMIDEDGNTRKEDWDDWEDYVNKILYIRYGQRGDTFFGRIGSFPSYTLGRGLVMRDYSNMLRYPEYRQIGLQLGGKLPVANLSLEGFSSNITKNEILAGRVTTQPIPESLPFLKNITFGATIAHDRNQFKGLLDTDDDNYPDDFDDYPYDDDWHNEVDHEYDEWWAIFQEINPNGTQEEFEEWFYSSDILNAKRNPSFDDLGEDNVTVLGVDYEIPLVSTDLFILSNYGEAAQIIDHNMGFIFPGFYSKFLIFHANLEFRYYQDDFTPAFFDQLYEDQRCSVVGDTLFTKEDQLAYRTESRGWYGSLKSDLFNFITLTVSYEDMYGENDIHHRSIWGKAALNKTFIPQLVKAEINYYQTNFDKLRYFKTPYAQVDGALGYALGGNTTLVAKYSERYRDLDGNGKIEGKVNDKPETIKTFGMGVEFRF